MSSNGHSHLAEEAGLIYMTDEAPGFRRVRRGKGFAYVSSTGEGVGERERERIKALVIPPAWDRVWISPEPAAHILATGYDNAGRKQYLYHPVWEDVRDQAKFERTAAFGGQIARLRKRVDADLRRRGLGREKVIALGVAVLDRTLIRVGNRRYADENESYGLTTLTAEHVDVRGHHVQLDFEGKGGAEHQVVFESKRLASLLARCQELDGQTLFSYENAGQVSAIRSDDINDYLTATSGKRFTAKDMRTWGATTVVVRELAVAAEEESPEANVLRAMDTAAEVLGNTREVCRSSYVHPEIPSSFHDGRLHEAWGRSKQGRWRSRAESAAGRILNGS